MTLTKKHFKAIAEILNKSLLVIDTDVRNGGRINILGFNANEILMELCSYFKSENPLFDEGRFKEAVLKDG